MIKKTILLVEDDFLNRRLTKKILSENGYVVLEAKSVQEALEIFKKEIVNLAILDINLGENNEDGISLGQQINEKYAIPSIYLTAYDNSEVIKRAIATEPLSYISKPFKNVDLITSVQIAIRKFNVEHIPKIPVKDNEYNVELPVDRINYLESSGNYLLIYTDEKTYKSRSTIKQIMEILNEGMFVQVHRAYVVNKTKIERFNKKSIIIRGEEIPLSKNYIEHIFI